MYLIAAGSCLAASGAAGHAPGRVAETGGAELRQAASIESVLEGLQFVRPTQIRLGAILLGLLAVLFGRTVALPSIFARTILHSAPPDSACCAPTPRSARSSVRWSSPAG